MLAFLDTFLIFIIFLIIALFLWMFTMYREIKTLFGTVVARRDLHRLKAIALGILVYFGFGLAIFSSFIKFGIVGFYMAGSTLVLPPVLGLVGYVSTWSRRKARAGVVLLDLGRYFEESTAGILVAGLSIVNSINLVISAFSHFSKGSEIAFYLLIYAMILGCLGIFWILLSLNHLEIRERGICYPFTVIKWEVIEAYRWSGSQENTLCIRHQAKFPFFPLLKFKIPLANKSRVEQLLSQYLPER